MFHLILQHYVTTFLIFPATMPLSSKEKQRAYRERIKSDPVKYAEYNEKERLRWEQRKKNIKSIKEMSQRDQRQQRRVWKMRQRDSRERRNTFKETIITLPQAPNCPEYIGEHVQQSRQRRHGVVMRARHRLRQNYEIKSMHRKLEHTQREASMYRKRWQRIISTRQDSLRTKTEKLHRFAMSSDVRRTLLFHNVVMEQIRSKYVHTREERERQVFARLLTGGIVKRYKMQHMIQKSIGLSAKRFRSERLVIRFQKRRYITTSKKLAEDINEFFCRDDNSRQTSGIRETITRQKKKMQKRFLSETIENLHKKFLAEFTKVKISYTSFWRLKPFWVVPPRDKDRETCLCRIHENLQIMATKLKQLNVIKTDNLDKLVQMVACDTDEIDCMYGFCKKCSENDVYVDSSNNSEDVSWQSWITKREERDIKNRGPKIVTITIKDSICGRVEDLISSFQVVLKKFKTHWYNIRHQYRYCFNLKKNMTNKEVLLHIDFAENYILKFHRAIQSAHFGASQKQISLHTGVMYTASCDSPQSFCSVSESLEHGPAGISAHLGPVLDNVKKHHREVEVIHVLSDSPTTQYRQKGNFFMFARAIRKRGFKLGSWNFLESGHGKGAPDGVGAALKRRADSLVAMGVDIKSVAEFFREMNIRDSSIVMYLITPKQIEEEMKVLESVKLNTISGTMQMHQFITCGSETIYHRRVSCMCSKETPLCKCYELKEANIVSNADALEVGHSGGMSKTKEQAKRCSSKINKRKISSNCVK